jgi:hypothetical protein
VAFLDEADGYLSRIVVELLARHGPALVSRFDMNAVRQLRRDGPDPADASSVIYMPSFDVAGGGNDVVSYTPLGRYDDDPKVGAVMDGFEGANAGASNRAVAGDWSSSPSPRSPPRDADEGATTTQPSYHAMVLIGSRFDNNKKKKKKKHWFLLQNSWKSLPMLEVSDAFLARHLDGRLEFVRRGVVAAAAAAGGALGSVLSTHGRLYQECRFDDGGDTRAWPLEDSDPQ